MSTITYLKGDATSPQAAGNKVLCHVVNDAGHWAKGFVAAVSARWKEPEEAFRRWHAEGEAGGFALGALQLVPVGPDLWVANMLAQRGTRPRDDGPLIRYDALRRCLEQVRDEAVRLSATAHMPRIGCGLAGGEWPEVERILHETLCQAGVGVFVYDVA